MRREQEPLAGVRPGSKPAHTATSIGYTARRDAILGSLAGRGRRDANARGLVTRQRGNVRRERVLCEHILAGECVMSGHASSVFAF